MKKFLSNIISLYIENFSVRTAKAKVSRGYTIHNNDILDMEKLKKTPLYGTTSLISSAFFQEFLITTSNYILSFKIDSEHKFSLFLGEEEVDSFFPLWTFTNNTPCTIHFIENNRIQSLNTFNPIDLLISGIQIMNTYGLRLFLKDVDEAFDYLNPNKEFIIQKVTDNNIYIPMTDDGFGPWSTYTTYEEISLTDNCHIFNLRPNDTFRALKLEDVKISISCKKREK